MAINAGLRAVKVGTGKKWTGRYGNGTGTGTVAIFLFPTDVSRPLPLLISVPAFPVPPQDELFLSHSLSVPLSAHSLPIPFPTLTLFLPSHFPLSIYSLTISFPIVGSFFPSHIPLEYDLSQAPPSNIRTNCCLDMHIQPGVK